MTDRRRERIPVASDHAGFGMKAVVVCELEKLGYEADDLGASSDEPSDYPDFAHPLAKQVSTGEAGRGILLCGSGIGVDIVANRYRGVRAALAWNPEVAELSRRHNDSNILVLPSRFVSDDMAVEMVRRWLDTSFEGGRHGRRVGKIDSND